MKYLIDTHIFLWMISSPEKLSLKVTEIIENKNNILFLSVASCWEVVIKHMIKKLTLPIMDPFVKTKNSLFLI